jgi:hypothetical protein
LNKKFARRFVMVAAVIIRTPQRYLPDKAQGAKRSCLATKRA